MVFAVCSLAHYKPSNQNQLKILKLILKPEVKNLECLFLLAILPDYLAYILCCQCNQNHVRKVSHEMWNYPNIQLVIPNILSQYFIETPNHLAWKYLSSHKLLRQVCIFSLYFQPDIALVNSGGYLDSILNPNIFIKLNTLSSLYITRCSHMWK